MFFLQLRRQCRSAEEGSEGRENEQRRNSHTHTHARMPCSSERTILCEFCGADLSPHKEVIPWSEQVWGEQVLLGGVIDAGEGGVLVGSSNSLPELRGRERRRRRRREESLPSPLCGPLWGANDLSLFLAMQLTL